MGSKPIGISGSRAAAIIGLSQYQTPFMVWQELMEAKSPGFNAKRGYIYEPFEGNPATEFGKAFESPIISLTEQIIGDKIIDQERAYSLPDMNYVTCHLDGRLKKKKTMYEGKSCNHRAFYMSWGEPGTDRIPQTYQVQNQHSMLCTGINETTMGVLVFPATVDEWAELGWKAHHDQLNGVYFLKNHNTDKIINPIEWAKVLAQMGFFHQYHIEAKPTTQAILKELYEEFWFKYVLEETTPDAVDFSDIKRIFIEPKGTLVISDKMKIGGESVADIMREYKNIGKEIGSAGHLKKRQTFIKTQVLKFASDKTTVADEESAEKVVFMDESGHKLGSFNGKIYRS